MEQQLAEANLRLAELALCLRLAVYHIPKDVLDGDPTIKADVDEWLKDSQELLEAPDQLLREAEEKTKKFMDATKRMSEVAEQIAARRKAIEKALDTSDDIEIPVSKRSRKLDI